MRDLEQLGMPPALLGRFRQAIRRPHGLVVVTGPTGSGKTSTLYSALKILSDPEVKIITVEDPFEYRLPRVNQVQVNAQIGLTFARVLRTTLGQDSDIVLVGEMRDQETAEIALRAAMTGHRMLSTLHTNDALSTVSRLLDMGAQGFLLAAALHAVLAQRLIRRICANCSAPTTLDPLARAWAELRGGAGAGALEYHVGAGCHECNNTGYKGRIGVYELLEIDPRLGHALTRGDTQGFMDVARRTVGYRPLDLVALDYAQAQVTTVAEAMRVSTDTERKEAPVDRMVRPVRSGTG